MIAGTLCRAVAGLVLVETRATRARTAAMVERVQAETERVVRARGAMSVVSSVTSTSRWLPGTDAPTEDEERRCGHGA